MAFPYAYLLFSAAFIASRNVFRKFPLPCLSLGGCDFAEDLGLLLRRLDLLDCVEHVGEKSRLCLRNGKQRYTVDFAEKGEHFRKGSASPVLRTHIGLSGGNLA